MARFLFVTWQGGGNQPPAIGAAQELQTRGHSATFAGYASQRDRFMQLGFEFHVLQEAEALVPNYSPEDVIAFLVGAVWACPAHLRDLPAILSHEHYDVVVVDCLMFGALAAAEVAGLPTAVLVHSAPGLLVDPGGPLEQMMMEPVNAVRHAAGLGIVNNPWQAWERFPTLCTTIPELDPLASATPATFKYVGPIVDRVPHSGWRAPWPEHDPRPLVVISFTTGNAWDQRSRIGRTLEGLGSSNYRILVTSGMANVDGLPVPPTAALLPFVPHSEIMGQAAVTITHAGHGTVAAALAHGVSLVCLPNLAANQPGLAARVAHLGAGVALAGDTASPEEIRRAVTEVCANPSYAARARQLAEAIAVAGGAKGAATLLEQSVEVSPR